MVMLKFISLTLLFLVRLRFPVGKSIACVLRSRYGNTMVKDIRKFEKIDFELRKCKLDLLFLETCLENQIIPKFLNFRTSNLHLKTSRAYHACQLFNLGIESSKTSHYPQKVIFNYSCHVLSESEKSLLSKGLNFAIPPENLEYSHFYFILNFFIVTYKI